MRIGVCIPCRDEVHTGFAFDFARMAAHDASTRCKDGKGGLSLYTMPGTLIFDQREKLAEVAFNEGCDAVLFIDSDMRFPHDIISILLSRNVPIVGVNATTRRKPVTPTAKMLTKYMDGETLVHNWSNVDSRGKEGIEQVTAVGFGAVMIRREVFEKTGRPWFDAGWGASGVCGEDVYFCVKAGSEGFETYVDHELSMHIRHIGTYEYGWKDFEQLEE
jgi:hypothetical protein